MNKEAIQKELSGINEKKRDLEEELKQCKSVRDYVQQDRIRKEIRVLANRAKHLLFKLGKYRYEEGDPVEYSPGEFMDANVYHWLKD